MHDAKPTDRNDVTLNEGDTVTLDFIVKSCYTVGKFHYVEIESVEKRGNGSTVSLTSVDPATLTKKHVVTYGR